MNNNTSQLTAESEEELMDVYLDLVEKFGPDSDKVREFLEKARQTPGFSELVSAMNELKVSSRRMLWIRRLIPGIWAASIVMVALLGWVAVHRGEKLAAFQWGWNNPKVLEANVSSPAYLNELANAAEQWFEEQPETADRLAKRITEFRLGCTRLILAEKKPLSPDDRHWLNTKCRAWGEKLDHELQSIDAGAQPLQVRDKIEEIVKESVKTFRSKAAQQ